MMPTAPALAPTTSDDPVFARIAWRLLPFLLLLYVLAHIDRSNVGVLKAMAGPQFAALGFDAYVWGLGIGIFYLGYCVFEIPSNLLLERIGARRWIARIMVSWGLIAVLMMCIQGPASYYGLRFLLGVAEAGFFPGVVLYLTYWFPAQRRARAAALFLTSICVANTVTGPLTAYCLELDQVGGLAGWQWVFLLQGLPSVLVGLLVLVVLPDRPQTARWLSADERRRVAEVLDRERQARPDQHLTFVQALAQPRLWLLVGLYFLLITAFYGVTQWLPSFWKPLVQQLWRQWYAVEPSNVNLGWALTVPYLATGVAMVLWSRSSDRRQERRWHAALAGLVGVAGLALVGLLPPDGSDGRNWLALAATTCACLGTFSALGPFWSLATEYLRGSAAAGGIALINGLGCLGGFAGPYLVPWLQGASTKGVIDYAYLGLGLSLLLFSTGVLLVRRRT